MFEKFKKSRSALSAEAKAEPVIENAPAEASISETNALLGGEQSAFDVEMARHSSTEPTADELGSAGFHEVTEKKLRPNKHDMAEQWLREQGVPEHEAIVEADCTTAHSEILRANFEAAGGEWPGPRYDMAHIVPSGETYESAERARELLAEANIGINDSANGLPLASGRLEDRFGNPLDRLGHEAVTVHSETHTEPYYDAIADELEQVHRDERQDVLESIKDRLFEGKIPGSQSISEVTPESNGGLEHGDIDTNSFLESRTEISLSGVQETTVIEPPSAESPSTQVDGTTQAEVNIFATDTETRVGFAEGGGLVGEGPQQEPLVAYEAAKIDHPGVGSDPFNANEETRIGFRDGGGIAGEGKSCEMLYGAGGTEGSILTAGYSGNDTAGFSGGGLVGESQAGGIEIDTGTVSLGGSEEAAVDSGTVDTGTVSFGSEGSASVDTGNIGTAEGSLLDSGIDQSESAQEGSVDTGTVSAGGLEGAATEDANSAESLIEPVGGAGGVAEPVETAVGFTEVEQPTGSAVAESTVDASPSEPVAPVEMTTVESSTETVETVEVTQQS
jgi:hypothetical protein